MSGGKALLDYNPKLTQECLQVLALLLSGIGQWKSSIVLIGGLTPEVLVKARPPKVPAYVGTGDIDLVMDLAVMTNPEAYGTFEEALKKQGFKPLGPEGEPSWRWEFVTDSKTTIRLEFVADDPSLAEWRVRAVPEHGQLGALNIHRSSIVFDFCQTETITVELPGELGVTKQDVLHADIVGFTILKILAFRSRGEGKDAHDLVYCLQHGEQSVEEIADRFVAALGGRHAAVVDHALADLAAAFGDEDETEGYRKDGPTRAARFEIEGDDQDIRERRLVRQRDFSNTVNTLLQEIARRRPAARQPS
jgi:hypothetical protein